MYSVFRSTCPKAFCKKDVLRNFSKFTGKHMCQSLFFNIDSDTGVPVDFVKFLRTTFLTKHLRWLLLYIECTFRIYILLHIKKHYFIHILACFKTRRKPQCIHKINLNSFAIVLNRSCFGLQ